MKLLQGKYLAVALTGNYTSINIWILTAAIAFRICLLLFYTVQRVTCFSYIPVINYAYCLACIIIWQTVWFTEFNLRGKKYFIVELPHNPVS